MGRIIAAADSRLPRTRAAGLALALGLPLICAGLGWLALAAASRVSALFAWLAESLLIYFCLACRDMWVHAGAVLAKLKEGDLVGARDAVRFMVGRDTEALDEGGVARACVESVAEGACDALVAPIFWAALLGAPGALAYRAVSTLDSMVGYKNESYLSLGWASARLDDLLNFVPARLSLLLTMLAAPLLGLDPGRAWKVAWRDAPRQPSPNSGWPEAAFAGALGVRLGGQASYGGRVVVKAPLGENQRPLDGAIIGPARRLYLLCGLIAALFAEAWWRWNAA
jgi:adenosylcobinamide-phosphate synthase